MKIILDTNIIFPNLRLENAPMRIFERYLSIGGDELCIPEVVIEETIRHFRKKYTEALNAHDKAFRVFQIVGIEPGLVQGLEDATSNYRGKLAARLQTLHARILPLPTTQLRTLLIRDLDERKPFDNSGRGFRDALIWETVLEDCTRHDEKVIFITNDTDFEETSQDKQIPPRLHAHFIADLTNAGLASDRVTLYRSLDQFNEDFVKPRLTTLYREGDPTKGTLMENLDPEDILARHRQVAERDLPESLSTLLSINSNQVQEIRLLQWPENVKTIEALNLEDNSIQVLVQTSILFDAKLYMDEESYFRLIGLSKEGIVLPPHARRWNNDLRCFDVTVRMQVVADFNIVWNTTENSANSVELLRIALSEQRLREMRPHS